MGIQIQPQKFVHIKLQYYFNTIKSYTLLYKIRVFLCH